MSQAGGRRILRRVTLTDAASVTLDPSLGDIFTLTAGGNRTILSPGAGKPWQIIEIIHHALSSDRQLTLTTGSTNNFIYGTDITVLPLTAAGKRDVSLHQYNPDISRWMVLDVKQGY